MAYKKIYNTLPHKAIKASQTHWRQMQMQKQKIITPKKRLFVDMDGTLTEFRKDTQPKDIYKRGYFENLKPQSNVIAAINIVITSEPRIQVIPLTGVLIDSRYAEIEKRQYLKKYIPNTELPLFVPAGDIKANYVPNFTPSDTLLDDFTKNLLEWPGNGIKLINNINDTNKTWKGTRVYYNDPPEKLARNIIRATLQI